MMAPVRLEMLEALRLRGPCTIAEVAEFLDRPADALYSHMDRLVRLGAVKEREPRKVGRRHARTFDIVADHLHPGFRDGGSEAANQAYDHTVKVICKIVSRASRDASRAQELSFGQTATNLAALLHHGWLTPAEFAKARRLIVRLVSILDGARRRPDTRLYVLGAMLLPVVRRRGARPAAATSSRGRGQRVARGARRT